MPEIIGTSKSISGFDPRSIPGCVLWLDAADASTVTTSGTTVTAIRDKSITGTVLTSPAGFTYPNNTFNGTYPSFYNTNATGGRLGYNSSFSLGSQNTVFIVGQLTSPSAGNQFFDFIDGYTSTNRFFLFSAPNFLNNYVYANNGGVSGQVSGAVTVAQMTSPFCWSVVSDTSTSSTLTSQYVNGTQLVQSTSTIAAISSYTGIIIGQRFTQANESVVGHICEFMIFNNTLSTAQRQQVEGYLAWKWGIEVIPQAPTVPGVSPLNLIPGNPTDIPGCVLWLDAADTQAMTLSGSNVTTWIDKSGLGNNATSYNTPVLTANAINGVQAISTSNLPYFTGSVSVTGTTVTIFCVATTTRTLPNGGSDQRLVSLENGANVDYGRTDGVIGLFNQSSSSWIGTWRVSGPIASNAIVTNTPFVAVSRYDGTNGYLWLNGVAGTRASSASTGTFAVTKYGIGNQANPSGEYWQGFIGEVIIYSNALSDTQRQQVEGYLGRKWGIATPLETSVTSITSTACRVWLDASDTTTLFQNTAGTTAVTADGQSVACWKDKSPNAYTFTQATGANQPTFKTAVMNGQNTLRWNGTSMFLQSSTTLPFFSTTTSGGTFFFVFNASQISSQRFLMHYQNSVSGSYCSDATDIGYTTGATAQGNFGFHRGCGNAVVALKQINQLQANENMLMTGVLGTTGSSPANVQIFKNGRASTVQNDGTGYFSAGSYPSSNNVRYLNIGSRNLYGLGPDAYHFGDIAEIIWFNVALTTAQQQQIESYLSTKWGIPMYGNGYTQLLYSPANVPGCVLWLDAADTTTITDVSQPTPLSYFPFEGSIVDQSNVITLTRTGSVPYVTGKYGQGVSFTNAQGALSSNYLSSTYAFPSTFTASMWFQTPTPSPSVASTIFYTNSNPTYVLGGAVIYFAGGNLYCAYSSVANNATAYPISANTWYHVAITYNSGSLTLFVNGVQSGNVVTGTNSKNGFTLGGSADNPGTTYYPFTGYIDELLIYNSVLTLTQIYSIYSLTRPISSWRDKSPNAYTANSFSNSVTAPSFVSNAPGVGTAVQYSAGNGSSIANFVLKQTMSIFEVYYPINQATDSPFLEHGPDENANSGFYFHAQNNNNFAINSGSGQVAVNSGNVAITNTWQLIEGINPDPSSSSTMAFYVDGQLRASGSTQSGTTTVTRTLFINGRNGANSISYNAYLAELIIFSNALNATQRQAVERYLSFKWGLSNFHTSIPGSVGGLMLWLDGGDPSTMTFPSGSNISAWKDKASLGITVSNLNAGYYPTYVSGLGVYTSNASANCNTTNQVLTSTTTWYVPTQNMTLLVSYKLTTSDALREPVYIGGGAGFTARPNFALCPQCGASEGDFMVFDLNSGAWSQNAYSSINTYSGLRIDTLVSIPGASSGFIYVNGIEPSYSILTVPYTSTYTNYPAVVQISGGSLMGNRVFNGYIQEILFYSNVLTTAQRTVVEGYLARKWNNTSIPTEVLPLTHAFALQRPLSRAFSPLDMPNCILWLDGADKTTMTPSDPSSGTSITAWKDKSSNGVTYSSGAVPGQSPYVCAAPTYASTGGLLFNPTVSSSFTNNVTQGLNAVGGYSLNLTGSTLFVVARANGATISYYNSYISWTSSTNGQFFDFDANGSAGYTDVNADSGGLGYNYQTNYTLTNAVTIQCLRLSTTGASTFINGAIAATSTFNSNYTQTANPNSTTVWIGNQAPGARSFSGTIYELLIFNTALSTSQRQQVDGYLGWKWGASLSSSNAFYKFPPSSALPFLPTNITNCALWLDASSPTQFNTFSFASGSNVRIWYDKSGSNNHATASAGAYPTYSYESNCVVWNGTSSSQFVLDTNITNAVVNKGFTIFVVSQRTVSSENFFMRGTNTAVNSNLLIGHGTNSGYTIRFAFYGNDLDYNSVPSYTSGEPPSIISFHYSKPNRAIYYNGTLGSSDTNSSDLASWTGAMVGGGGGSWPAYQGNIFEIIIYGAVLTTAQRQMVEGYLAQKWKI